MRTLTSFLVHPGVRAVLGALVALATAGCAVVPPGVDLQQVSLAIDLAAPKVHVDAATSAGRGTGIGALGGTSAAALASPALCAASGFLFPVCIIAVVSSGAGIGAATGAAAGANIKEDIVERQAKLNLVMQQVAAKSQATTLAVHLEQVAHEHGADWSLSGSDAANDLETANPDAPRWVIEVAVADVTTSGKARFQLEVEVRVRVRRADDQRLVFEHGYREDSDAELTLAQWSADDAHAIEREIADLFDTIARRIVKDLTRTAAGTEGGQRRHASASLTTG